MSFIIRLFLQTEDQVGTSRGSECSGTIIDNHWIATSYDCCQDIVAFRLVNYGDRKVTRVEQGNIGIGPLQSPNGEIQEISRTSFYKNFDLSWGEIRKKYDICLIQTKYDIIKVGRARGFKPSKICFPDKEGFPNRNFAWIYTCNRRSG